MEMNAEFYIDTIGKSPFYKTPPESFWDPIGETAREIANRFPDWPRLIQAEAINKLIVAYCLISSNEFNERFTHYKRIALKFPRDPSTLWRTIATGVLSPDLERAYLKSISLPYSDDCQTNPSPTPSPQEISPQATPTAQTRIEETPKEIKPRLELVKKLFSLKIAMRLCVAWMLDPRWQELSPCAKLLFYWLIFRTYRKDTIRKIKQALANGETCFPWCCTGIKSLSKQLTYQPGSSKKMKHYEDCQIKRALRQLWDLGFIHRIFRGYENQGAGKYHVFLNPKMSARFNKSSMDVKKGITRKKSRSRMG